MQCIISSYNFYDVHDAYYVSFQNRKMEKLTDIELISIEATDPKPRSFANDATAILIQVEKTITLSQCWMYSSVACSNIKIQI